MKNVKPLEEHEGRSSGHPWYYLRSEKLRKLQAKFKADLKSDLSRYRQVVRELHHQRKTNRIINIPVACSDVHTSMSLKNAHLYNDFAHLHFLDELLSKQLDLFGI